MKKIGSLFQICSLIKILKPNNGNKEVLNMILDFEKHEIS